MRYVEVELPDGSTRLYRFRTLHAAERFIDESPDTRGLVYAVEMRDRYPIYAERHWRMDEYGHWWCRSKWW